MKTSQAGLNLIKSFEGCRLTAYKPVKTEQYYTIGYGHYGPDVRAGAVITKEQAEAYLTADLLRFERMVSKYQVKYGWTQNEFDALVSFTYNLGAGNLDKLTAGSTRTKTQIAEKILAYNKAGGNVLSGLTKRRAEEQALFTDGQAALIKQPGEYSAQLDGSTKLSANFAVREFKCKDGSDKIIIDPRLVVRLQKIRDYFDKPVTINSGYRTATYNKKVGGASKSYHLQGKAADIQIKGIDPMEIARYAASMGVPGVILYPGRFCHIDVREKRYWGIDGKGSVGGF